MPSTGLTLGILAGGRAERLGGCDKAWLQRDGLAQVLRWHRCIGSSVDATVVSANRGFEHYRSAGLVAVPDRIHGGCGPIAGLEALAAACTTEWLVTVPVDIVRVPDWLVARLLDGRGAEGAYACDHQGIQPLVAVWRTHALRKAAAHACRCAAWSVQTLQKELRMEQVVFADFEFGNLNTPRDLAEAGIEQPHE